jgi:guanylate kinase
MTKQVVVIAGPAGSGKDSIARSLLKRFPNMTLMVTATTRAMRPSEQQGVNYHFFTNDEFKRELEAGNIPEHYHRDETDTYYGTYEPDIEQRLASGKTVLAVVQIVGAKYLKEKYNATTVFIMPPSLDAFEKRVRGRAPMSDVEWQERLKFTQNEVADESPWYDYRISNEDGQLESAVNEVIGILRKEGYNLD